MSEFGTSSSTPLLPEQVKLKKQQGRTNYYFRLPQSYEPFFQAMAENYYQRSKIKAPSISLLAKTCLIITGNAWNRMQIQLMNQNLEKRRLQQEADNLVNRPMTEREYPTSHSEARCERYGLEKAAAATPIAAPIRGSKLLR